MDTCKIGACKRTSKKLCRTTNTCEPVLTKTRSLRLDGVGFNFHRFSSEASLDKVVALSNGSTDMVMYKPNNCECWCLWKSIASSKQHRTKWRELDRKPKQRERQPITTTPTEGTSCSSRKCPQRPLACTCLHTRTLQSCCGLAAKELTAPVSRSQAT